MSISSKSFSGNQTKRCGPQNLCNTRAGFSGFPTLVDIRLNEGDFFRFFCFFFAHTLQCSSLYVLFVRCMSPTSRTYFAASRDVYILVSGFIHPRGFTEKIACPNFGGQQWLFFRKKGQRTPCPPDVSKGGFAAGVSCIRYVNPFVVFPHHRLANHPGLLGGCQPPHVIWKRGRAQFGLGWRFRRKKEPNPDYVFTISPT